MSLSIPLYGNLPALGCRNRVVPPGGWSHLHRFPDALRGPASILIFVARYPSRVTTKDKPGELEVPGDEVRKELTREERERLGQIADSWGLVTSKVNFKFPNIMESSALAKTVVNAGKFSSLFLSESLADQQMRILDSLRPALDLQGIWIKGASFINSDIFKTYVAAQMQFAELGAMLMKGIDPGVFAKIGQQLFEQHSPWMKSLASAFEWLREPSYPPNLRGIKDLSFEEIRKVVLVDGIALYGLPRVAVSEAIIRAEGTAKRREILGRRWRAISADCREVLDGCESQFVAPYIPFALAALDALVGGHIEAAQALAGSLIDTLLTARFGKNRYLYTPDKTGNRTSDVYDEFNVRQFVAFAPMWQAYQKFWVADGDAIPRTFNRNATAHAVSRRQFSRSNAMQALMFATGLIHFFDEHPRELQTDGSGYYFPGSL
mgnify:FL=1